MQPSLLGSDFCWSAQATPLKTLLFSVSSEDQHHHDDDHCDRDGDDEDVMHVHCVKQDIVNCAKL